jgi:hypothetical protein
MSINNYKYNNGVKRKGCISNLTLAEYLLK